MGVLVRQSAPVERVVVLKIGPHLPNECQKPAKLQNPHVVPVYSFHPGERVQAVCMPYRGPLTLAHLVARLRAENLVALDGKTLTTAINECRGSRQSSVAGTAAPDEVAADAPPRNCSSASAGSPTWTRF